MTQTVVRDPQILGRILGAGQRLFVERGYHATKMSDIAEAAELKDEVSLHHYFRSKPDLMLRLFMRVEEDLVVHLAERVANVGPSAKDKLFAFLDEKTLLSRTYVSDSLLRILMSLEFQSPNDKLCVEVRKLNRHIQRTVEGIIEFGKFRGTFRSDLATRELAAMIIAAHDGAMLQLHRSGADLDGRQLVKALQFSLVRGLEVQGVPEADLVRTSWRLPGLHP